MVWIRALLRWFGRMVLALLSFFAIAIGWTAVLYAVNLKFFPKKAEFSQ